MQTKLKSNKAMTVTLIFAMLWVTQHISGTSSNNFYFATHATYINSTLDSSIISSTKMAGNVDTVTQQCRRSCAQDISCKAHEVTLLEAEMSLGIFNCSFYELNACNYRLNSLQNTSAKPYHRLWEKLDADTVKPKPCIEYCVVKARGDCKICGGLSNFTGLACEIPPVLCSDYTMAPSDQWVEYPVWPWGLQGRNLTVSCRNLATLIIMNKPRTVNSRSVQSLGAGIKIGDTLANFKAIMKTIDWRLISELQSLSTEKKLIVSVTLNSIQTLDYTFSGFKISPTGELSLKASLDTPISTGFPTLLYKVPFMEEPLGFDTTCGPFWRFNENFLVCEQRTKLFNFGKLKWDGITSTDLGTAALSFK